jgi:LysM repeat protein
MESVRRVLIAVGIALASLVLVVGGLSLSLAENMEPAAELPSSVTPSLAVIPSATPEQVTLTNTATATATSSPAPTLCMPPQGWVAVIIQAGQTLQSIAIEFNSSVEILVKANCLASADVPAGSLVYVPPKPSQPVPTQPKCGPPAGWITYIVRPGDTLYSIALRYRVTVSQLMFANCLNGTIIYSGQRLYVPNVPTITPSATLMVISTITPSLTNTLEMTTEVATTEVTDTPVPPTDTPVPPTDTPVPPTDTSVPATTP